MSRLTAPRPALQTCSCGTAVLWCDTVTQMRVPVDAEPDPAGTYRVEHQRDGRALAIAVPVDEQPTTPRLHRQHYLTCGNKFGSFRRPDGRARSVR